MDLWQAILLGIIQGLAEFLPVSSSGQLELAKAALGVDMEGSAGLAFTIYLHVGTALATVVVFRKTIWDLLKGLFEFRWNEQTRYLAMIAVSMIPAGIAGLFFMDYIDLLFEGNVLLVGSMLILTAALLLVADRARDTTRKVSFASALIIGLSQALAILPGLSRSGTTISTSVLCKVDRGDAARFSFLMVLPLIFGQIAKDILDGGLSADMSQSGAGVILVGTLVSFLVGIAACRWMIALVKRAQLKWFAVYCLIVGAAAIAWKLFF